MTPKACSTAVPCHVGLAGTLCAPQIAPWEQGRHQGTSLLPLRPSQHFPRGIPHPVRLWGAGQERASSPARGMLGNAGRMASERSGSSPGSTLEAPPFSGSSFEGVGVLVRLWGSWGCAPARDVGQDLEDTVQAIHRGRHCRQESDGQEGGGLLAPAFCLIWPDIPLAPGSVTLLCFLFISTGQETADL